MIQTARDTDIVGRPHIRCVCNIAQSSLSHFSHSVGVYRVAQIIKKNVLNRI